MTKYAAILLGALLLLSTGCTKKERPRAVIAFIGDTGVEIRHKDRVLGVTPLTLQLKDGSYFFRFSAPGKIDEWKQFRVKSGDKHTVALQLKQQKSDVLLESIPAGAEVIMDGKTIGVTPLVLTERPVGKYSAEFRLKGYALRKAEWELPDARPRAVKVNLASNIGKLEIKSTPAKARVQLDGNVVGTTPYRTELEEGKYTLRLEYDGCTPLELPVSVERNKTNVLALQLTALPGGIQVNSDPEGAAVILNDQKRGITPCRVSNLPPGVYELRVEKPGYDTEKKMLDIVSGTDEELNFQLLASTGGMELDIRPAGVTVMLDGKIIAKTEASAPDSATTKLIRLTGISPGTHKLTYSHRFAYPQSRTMEIEVHKGKIAHIRPLELWVANCEIKYHDGRVERGALFYENEENITFGPEPGIKIQIEKSRLQSVTPLDFN